LHITIHLLDFKTFKMLQNILEFSFTSSKNQYSEYSKYYQYFQYSKNLSANITINNLKQMTVHAIPAS